VIASSFVIVFIVLIRLLGLLRLEKHPLLESRVALMKKLDYCSNKLISSLEA
jgi:hypothetical protein